MIFSSLEYAHGIQIKTAQNAAASTDHVGTLPGRAKTDR